MLALCFSADGQRVAAAGTDNAIHVYDVKTGRRELRAEVHADWITALAFNADGSRILSASRDKTARFIDPASGEVLATYTADEPLLAAALSDQTALTGGRDRKVTAWSTKDAAKIASIDSAGGDILRLLATKDVLFSGCSDKKVRQYALPKRDLVREYPHDDWVYALAYHENSKRLATGAFNGQVRIWDERNVGPVTSFFAAPGYRAGGP
jgi:WD40 repeat protein